MSQTKSSSLTKTTPKATSLLPQASSTTTTKPSKEEMNKPSTISTDEAEKMAPYYNPVHIGTRGTVGSLVLKEIEYFNQLELSCRGDSEKPQSHVVDNMAASSSTSHASKPTHGSGLATQKKKKKKRGGSGHLPSMCSMVEVSDNNKTRPVGIPGFSYRNLKTDVKKLQA